MSKVLKFLKTPNLDQVSFRIVFSTIFFIFAFMTIETTQASNYTEQQKKLIQQIENYFANLKTYQADFLQVNPDRTVSKGQFYLQRPDRFRLAYTEPKETILISDGSFFIEYDPKDNIPNFLSLDSTPASILMKKDIKLSGEISIHEIQAFDDIVQATLFRTGEPNLGAITLTFKQNPFQLVHWVVHDAQGNMIEVGLRNIKENEKLNQNLFRAPS